MSNIIYYTEIINKFKNNTYILPKINKDAHNNWKNNITKYPLYNTHDYMCYLASTGKIEELIGNTIYNYYDVDKISDYYLAAVENEQLNIINFLYWKYSNYKIPENIQEQYYNLIIINNLNIELFKFAYDEMGWIFKNVNINS